MQDAPDPVQYPGTVNANGGTPYGIEAQHLPHPSDNRDAVHELFNRAPGAESAPDDHLRIVTSDTPVIGGRVKEAAMRLHTDVYLQNGIITSESLNEEGLYVDEYTARSKYYVVKNSQKIADARQIACDRRAGILSLPTAHHFSVDAAKLAEGGSIAHSPYMYPPHSLRPNLRSTFLITSLNGGSTRAGNKPVAAKPPMPKISCSPSMGTICLAQRKYCPGPSESGRQDV